MGCRRTRHDATRHNTTLHNTSRRGRASESRNLPIGAFQRSSGRRRRCWAQRVTGPLASAAAPPLRLINLRRRRRRRSRSSGAVATAAADLNAVAVAVAGGARAPTGSGPKEAHKYGLCCGRAAGKYIAARKRRTKQILRSYDGRARARPSYARHLRSFGFALFREHFWGFRAAPIERQKAHSNARPKRPLALCVCAREQTST